MTANSLRLVWRGWGFVTKINWHHVLFKWHLRECCFRGGLCSTQPLMYARCVGSKARVAETVFSRALSYIIISNANVFLHLDAKKKNRLNCPRKVFICFFFLNVFTEAHCDPVMRLKVFVLLRLFSHCPDSLSKCEAWRQRGSAKKIKIKIGGGEAGGYKKMKNGLCTFFFGAAAALLQCGTDKQVLWWQNTTI